MNWLSSILRTKVIAFGNGKKRRVYLASFQSRVAAWVSETFLDGSGYDKAERDARFMEEAIELFQARGRTIDELWALVQYVYSKEPGEVAQELGGVQTTLAALASAIDVDMKDAAETELARMWTKMEAIRAKNATKPRNSPLPGHYPGQGPKPNNWQPTEAQVISACHSYDHSFGLLKEDAQKKLKFQAREWLRAWLYELPATPALRSMPLSAVKKVD